MDSSIRASAFAGLGAFALSVIVAWFSRVPVGALLLRALLAGAGFAVRCFGALWLLRRFLPDLFDDSARPTGLALDGQAGTLVDIVLPGGDDERPGAAMSADGSGRQLDAASPDGAASMGDANPRRAAVSESDLDLSLATSLDSGELQREVASLRADTLISNDPNELAPESGGAPRPSVALDELDTLPDLDGFSDTFSESHADGDASGGPSGADASRMMGVSDSMPTAGNPNAGTDPAVLAKAVQTLLRRDQKGQ